MNIIQCPHCRVRLQTKTAKLAGREVPCPKCGQRFMVSFADGHAAAEPPSHVSSMAEPVDAELVATEETGPHTSPPIAFPASVEPFQQSARQPSSKRSTTVLVAVAVSAPILGFLSVWVILTSLSAIGRSDSRGDSESETVTSNDGVAQITAQASRPSAWIEFEPPDGLFRAEFPRQPKQEKNRGNRIDFHYTDKDGVDYCVRVMPKPELANIPVDKQKLVEMSLSVGIAMEYYEKELRRRPLELNGHPGAEIVLQIKDQNIVDVYRLFLVDTTLFLLWVNGRASADHPDTERFFDSFSPGAAS